MIPWYGPIGAVKPKGEKEVLVRNVRYIAIALRRDGLWRFRMFMKEPLLLAWAEEQTDRDPTLTIYVYEGIEALLNNKGRRTFKAG